MNHPEPTPPDPTPPADAQTDPAVPPTDPDQPDTGAALESSEPAAPAESPTAPAAASSAASVEAPTAESAEWAAQDAVSAEPLAADFGGTAEAGDVSIESAAGGDGADDRTAEMSEAEPGTAELSAPAGRPVEDLPTDDVPVGGAPTAEPGEDLPTVEVRAGDVPADEASAGEQPTVEVPGGATAPGGATRVDGSWAAGGADVPPGGGEAPDGGAGQVPPGGGSGGMPPAGGVPPGGWVPPGGGVAGGGWGTFAGRRLTRSTQRKVVAGVAGGLGEYTGVDPVLFRVLFAVLTLFGGSGILLYAVGWLFLPADDQQVSPAESVIHRGPGGGARARDAAAAGALIVAGLVLAGVLALGDARDLALCLVIVGGAFFLLRNLSERRAGGPPLPVAPEPPPAPYETPLPAYQPAQTYQPSAYQPTPAATATLPPVQPAMPARTRQHSILGLLTLCALLVVLGVAAALEAGGLADPEPDDLLALAVGTLGAGLLVGTWFGRARWLVWLAVPLLVPLIVLSTSNVSLKGGAGDRRYAPQSAAEIDPEYRIGAGSLRLDLTDVDLSEQLVRTKLSAGVGDIEVIVPRDADVSVDGRAGIGSVELFGAETNGTSATRSAVDHGPSGDGTIDLALDLDVSIGKVEVLRATA